MTTARIRFQQGQFAALHRRLLADPRAEAFALLFGQHHQVGDQRVIKVMEARHPGPADYHSRGSAHLRLRRRFIYKQLADMQRRGDCNTVIDVHTHPFSASAVAFSGIDDADESRFANWLHETLDGLHYASIVLSRSDLAARLWQPTATGARAQPATLHTQTALEAWPAAPGGAVAAAAAPDPHPDLQRGFLARGTLALGLDAMRRITSAEAIAVIGVGGLGSVIAENLLHMGFAHLHLIDPDQVELSNLNRIVGATAADAAAGRAKTDAVAAHLLAINPAARVLSHPCGIEDPALAPVVAGCDWLLLATDNHASRFHAQQLALRFGIPLISAGVNITVAQGRITDMSGEVITARVGDRLCLNCLGRIAPTRIAAETVPGLGAELARRGYVTGAEVKEPAVKTLNAILGALAVEALVNQYTGRQQQPPVLVYENNRMPCLWPDTESVTARPKDCFHCG